MLNGVNIIKILLFNQLGKKWCMLGGTEHFHSLYYDLKKE